MLEAITPETLLKNLEKNIYDRAKLLAECEKNNDLKKYVYAMCKKDPVYFFEMFAWTDRNPTLIPERYGNTVPFILFEYQKDFIRDAWAAIQMWRQPISERTEPTDVFSEKSRQMWFSWSFAWLQLYWYMFHDLKSLYISKKADEVDKNGDIKSHFEKIRFMIRKLPEWLLPDWVEKNNWTECNKYMNISRKDWTWAIIWETANPNAWRWWTFAFVVFDEMAFMQYATAINMSISAATPCRFFNSTPNWEWNEYFKMRKLAVAWLVRYHKCHWSEHPFYTKEWYEWKIKGMTKEQIAQELEIDYNVAIQWRVYSNFKWETHSVDYNPNKPLYVIIDNSHWWADPHAVIITQPNYDSQFWDIIDSVTMNCDIPEMANFLAWAPKMALNDIELAFFNRYQNYNWRSATFVSDPYDTHSRIVNNHHPDWMVIYDEYARVWIHLNVPNTKDNPKTTQIIKTRNNIHRVRVNERCMDFISAIQNAQYPDSWATRTWPVDLPIHDWTSHYRTALEYMTIFLLDNFVTTANLLDKKERTIIEIKDPVTGEIKIVYN